MIGLKYKIHIFFKNLLKEGFKFLKDKYLLFYAKKESKEKKEKNIAKLFHIYNNKITFKTTIMYKTIQSFLESFLQIFITRSENDGVHAASGTVK